MKAAQIKKYSKDINIEIVDIPIPEIEDSEVLVKVKTAAVNPLDYLNITGNVKLIQDYKKPFTLGYILDCLLIKLVHLQNMWLSTRTLYGFYLKTLILLQDLQYH